jgi:TamB, inner membrane protein subunit of TAM complex
LKRILLESYKTFYIGIVSILWGFAILFAMLQNSFLSQALIKNALPYMDISVKEVRGGVFGVLTLEGVAYKNIIKCDELSFKADIFTLLNSKKLKISLLNIKALKLDRKKLEEELNKSDGKRERHVDSIEIDKASVEILDQRFGDIELKQVQLKLSSLKYDFKRLLFEYALDAKTNVVNTKCEGYFKDFNYTAKGELKSSGDGLINKLANDVDFDFNALGVTPFSLHGDDKGLSAKFEVKSSGVFYKYGVDAKIVNVKSELFLDFVRPYMKISSNGAVASKYGNVESVFDIIYDKKVTYKGSGIVKKFDYIPLGIFKEDIKILSSNGSLVSFEGDIHYLTVKAGKITAKGTIKGESLDVADSDTQVFYDFDKNALKVDVMAVGIGKYGSFDLNTTVRQDEKNRISFDGAAYIKDSKNLPIKDSLLTASTVRFAGNEENLHVDLASKIGSFLLKTNDYHTYLARLHTTRLSLAELLGVQSKLGEMSVGISAEGMYEYKKDVLNVDAQFHDARFLGKKASFSKLSLSASKGFYTILPFDFTLASLRGTVKMQGDGASQHVLLNANGMTASYDAKPNKQTIFTAKTDMNASGVWLEELFGVKKNSMSGALNISAIGNPSAGVTAVKIDSEALSMFGSDISPLRLTGSYSKNAATLSNLEFIVKQIPYKLDRPVQVSIDGADMRAQGISFGEKIFANADYKDGALKIDYRFRDFEYFNPKLAKFRLNGNGWAVLKNEKLVINGELDTKNLELFYSSRGAKITKDKDIKVIKPKNLLISEDWLLKNCSVNLKVTNEGIMKLKTKEANATLSPDILYYKDFGKKGNFVGLVKVLSGSYSLEGRTFKLEGGDITLIDGDEENPYIDLTLRLDEADISIYVRAKGFASSPKLTFWSKPALGEREIMSYLLFGIDDGFGFGKSGVKSDYTTKAIGALSSILSRDIASEFGVKLDKVEVSPSEYQGKDGKPTTGTKIEIGKKITKDLTVIYKNDVESGVALQYRLNKNVGIETESRSKGSSIELFYKQDY